MKHSKQLISSAILKEGLNYIEKEPMKNLHKLLNWAGRFTKKKEHEKIVQFFKEICNKPDNNWYMLIDKFFNNLNQNVKNKFIMNSF